MIKILSALAIVWLLGASEPVRTQSKNSTGKTIEKPLDAPFDTSTCTKLYTKAKGYYDGSIEYPSFAIIARDSLEHYIEYCYESPRAPSIFSMITNMIGFDTTHNADSGTRWVAYRDWLFKVLYLRWPFKTITDSQYYCYDAGAMRSFFRSIQGGNYAADVAILRYLFNSGKCAWDSAGYKTAVNSAMKRWYIYWKDTVQDSIATPFDTTIPTLQQIGFQILLGPPMGSVDPRTMPKSILGDVSARPNPFTHKSRVEYIMNIPATLMIEVFDALGAKVQSPLPAVYTHDGMHDLDIGDGLPSGTYYVRFSVPADDEVRTLKIVKE